ncbi:hypothetical protein OVA24_06275 [Luteolibacter sp. SL250]|uniref:hypothetical protein n=1 Tax=Luteolibacter sp. SL250 TaxID=2995170 RepID=UPI002270A948|nr:hypothetical protein [Luteolibacter sp. SL250]WAC20987.1 hypothetical protein OVA24_06275 [Luteolibacter sp. SL250]
MKFLPIYLTLTGATSGALTPTLGEITVSNAASMNYGGSLASDVQSYLAGLPASDEEKLLDLLAPPIQTNDFFQFAKADDEFFLTEADDSDIRAIGGSFKKVQFRGTTVTDATQQKGLTMVVDHKTLLKQNGKIVPGWENRLAESLKQRLVRAEIIRVLSVLDAAAVSAAKVWSSATNPDGDIRAMVQATRTATGQSGLATVVMGNAAQQLRQDAYEAAARANHAMANHATYTMEQLASHVGARKVIIEDGIRQTKKGAAKVDRTGLSVYSYIAEPGTQLMDPSNIKRAWCETPFNGKWAVIIKPGAVSTEITVFHESKIFSPITSGIIKRTVSDA